MKPINKSKLITAVLSSVAVLSMVGSVSGTVAWYQYSTRSSVSYSGASAKCTENLKVRLYRAPVEEDREHGIEEVKEYKTEWKSDLRLADVQKFIADERNDEDYALRPVTSGELDENEVATEFYAQPKRYTAQTSDWGKATKMDYVELPLQFRVEDNNGNAATNREYLAKNLYLADLTMKSTSPDGKKDITPALRVGVDATEDVTFSAHGEDVDVYSKLDLDGDGELDKMNDATGLDYDFDDQRAEIVYGDADKVAKSTKAVKANYGDTWVIDGADTKIEDHGNREGAYYKTAHKNEDAVEVYAFDDHNETAFHFVKIGDEYLALGAGAHTVAFDGADWTIDGAPADAGDIAVLNDAAPLYVLTDNNDAELRIIEVAVGTYEVIGSDAAIAKTEGRFVVDGEKTGLLVPADHEHDSYGVKAINEGAAKNVYEIVFWNDETILFDQKVDDASPRGMSFDTIDDGDNVTITRSNYEANRNRMLADDSDEDNVIGKPLGVTKAWTAANGAVGDDYWLSVTVRIYLEGWQELDPVAPDTATEIASKSLTKAEILASGNHDKVYIASDDHKVYTYVTDAWVGAAADPDAVYEIDGFYYTYQAAGEVEISPADAGSRVFNAKGKKTVAELTALADRKDGNSFINSEENKKYTWSADHWVIEDLADGATYYQLGNQYYLYHADADDDAVAQDVAEADASFFVAYGMKTTAELTALAETGPLANGDVYLTTANDKKYTWKDDGENPAGWVIEDLKAGDTYKFEDKYYAIKAGSFNVRPGGSIWDDKEYVGSAFNVGMTFAVDTY